MNREKILLADDSKFMRSLIKGMLVSNGFSVVDEAETGIEAVEKYCALKPGLLIMDVNMSVMSGFQALEAINAEFPHAKVIMCSSMGQQSYVKEAINSGAYDFIVKPFDEDRIISSVKKAFASSQGNEQRNDNA